MGLITVATKLKRPGRAIDIGGQVGGAYAPA